MSTKCAPLWREAHFQVKVRKTHQRRSTFGSWDVDKVRAAVARTTFPNQNLQSTKHTSVGACLEVGMSTKCTPLWREAHFRVEVYKARQRRSTLGSWDVDKVRTVVPRSISKSKCAKHASVGACLEVGMSTKCGPLWREAFPNQSAQNTPASEHFWKLGCRQSACSCGANNISKSKPAKHTSVGALLEVGMSTKCTLLRREAHVQVKMHKAPLHSTTLHSITLLDAPLHHTPLHYTPLRYTTLHQVHCMTLHYTTLDHTTHHYTPLHYNTLHATSLHYTALHYATPHSTTLHYTNCSEV